jgi:hypothetical protein
VPKRKHRSSRPHAAQVRSATPDVPASTGSVTLTYVHSDEVAYSWHHSLLSMWLRDLGKDGPLTAGGFLAIRCGTDGLPASRNEAVRQFLAGDSDWLFWIDTDMGFEADIVDRLVAVADPATRPVVGALCFAQREMAQDGSSGYRCKAAPTIYDWTRGHDKDGKAQQGFVTRALYDIDSLVKCDGTGSAAVLIHRTVFERIRDEFGPTWYNRAPGGQKDADGVIKMLGEDLSFCLRAGTVGTPIHVHTGVKTTHLKPVWLSEPDYLDQYYAAQVRAQMLAETVDATSA